MTKSELEQKTNDINVALHIPAEEKTRRINQLNAFYSQNQTRIAGEAKQKQINAESELKRSLKTAYMQSPVATDEDFERDYPILKSDFLRGEAMKNDTQARASQAAMLREGF